MSNEHLVEELFYQSDTNQLVSVDISLESFELKVQKKVTGDNQSAVVSREWINKRFAERDIIVIDSTYSGKGRNGDRDIYKQVIEPIFKDIFELKYKYVATTSAKSIHEFAKELSNTTTNAFIIFLSGDTSVNEFINGLETVKGSPSITLFPIPAGTGNSLALSLDLKDEVSAVKRLLTSEATDKPLNLYEVDFPQGSYLISQDEKIGEITQPLKFIVVLSWAFHASLVADSDTPEMRKHGIDRFKLAAYSNLSQEQRYEGNVQIENDVIEGPFAYFLLTSSTRFEPTFDILPKGNILDDSLYLVSFKYQHDEGGKYIIDIMGEVYNKGSHINDNRVTYRKITKHEKIKLNVTNATSIRQRRFCLDGSIIALPESPKLELKVEPTGNSQKGWNLFIFV